MVLSNKKAIDLPKCWYGLAMYGIDGGKDGHWLLTEVVGAAAVCDVLLVLVVRAVVAAVTVLDTETVSAESKKE